MNQFQFGICQAYLYNTTILRKQKKCFFSLSDKWTMILPVSFRMLSRYRLWSTWIFKRWIWQEKKVSSPNGCLLVLFSCYVYPYFFQFLSQNGRSGKLLNRKNILLFFSVCRLCPPLHHHGLSYETVFIFIFEKIRHWINKNRGKPERTLSYGKRRLHAKQASKKQKGKAVGYSLIKGKLKLQDVSITSHKRHKVVLSRPLRAKT